MSLLDVVQKMLINPSVPYRHNLVFVLIPIIRWNPAVRQRLLWFYLKSVCMLRCFWVTERNEVAWMGFSQVFFPLAAKIPPGMPDPSAVGSQIRIWPSELSASGSSRSMWSLTCNRSLAGHSFKTLTSDYPKNSIRWSSGEQRSNLAAERP